MLKPHGFREVSPIINPCFPSWAGAYKNPLKNILVHSPLFRCYFQLKEISWFFYAKQVGLNMAMVHCRECEKEVSTEAKECPNCGVAKPYKKRRKEWKDRPLWYKALAIMVWGPIILLIIVMYVNREESTYKKVTSLEDTEYQKKYEGYLRLHEINNSNAEYIENTIKYAKSYLKKVPVTAPETNLAVYKVLSELDASRDYSAKVNLYAFMRDVSTECSMTSHELSRKSLNNRSTFDSVIGSGGRWLNKNTYGYVHIFEGANAFGVVNRFTAKYLCTVDFSNKTHSVVRISVVRE